MTVLLTYKSRDITLDTYHRFAVSGAGFDRGSCYDSMPEAKAAIDRADAAARKAHLTTIKLPVLTGEGAETTIKNIHASQGRVLLHTKPPGWDDTTNEVLYPTAPWIKQVLAERKELSRRLNEIHRWLRAVEIKTRRVYGKIEPEQYEAAIAALVDDHSKATAKAITDPRPQP